MSHWNHRVTRSTTDAGTVYEIREVYYIGDRIGWTQDASAPYGETLDELRQDLERMLAALDKEVLDVGEYCSPEELKGK